MITLIELNTQLQALANDLSGPEQGTLMVKLGGDALALLRKRIQERGENAEGQKFEGYSTKATLVGRKTFVQQEAANRLLGSKPKRKELKWVTVGGHKLAVLEGGYKKIREMQGRQTAFVDFTFTGRMWDNVKITSDQAELNSGVAVIKATQELEKKKLSGLTERKGEILALSKSEEKQLAGYYGTWVENLVKKRFK